MINKFWKLLLKMYNGKITITWGCLIAMTSKIDYGINKKTYNGGGSTLGCLIFGKSKSILRVLV